MINWRVLFLLIFSFALFILLIPFDSWSKIGDEIKGCLDFLKFDYSKFGFSFKLFLSTRPDKYMGKLELWDSAEKVSVLQSW